MPALFRSFVLTALLIAGFGAQTLAADFQAGLDAYVVDDYAAALREFLPLAEQGDVNAQYYLKFCNLACLS